MSLQIQKSERVNSLAGKIASLEILVIRVGGQWFGVRSDRHIRLLSYEAARLNKPAEPALGQLPGLLGVLGEAKVPVFDLAYLLELAPLPNTSPLGQLIQVNFNGQALGFAIDQAQEIQRVALSELKQLPPIIKQLRSKPVVWAVWQRSPAELIPLLDCFAVLEKSAKQALQLGQG
jgi:chemotaxis signal transduction protein